MDLHTNSIGSLWYRVFIAFFVIFSFANTVFAPHSFAAELSDHTIDFRELYTKTYETALHGDKDSQQKAKTLVAGALGVSSGILEGMLREDPTQCTQNCLLQQHCPKNENITTLQECKKTLEQEVSQRFNQLQTEKQWHGYSLASQGFLNGTLQDTGKNTFDIVVDLNILDLLFFGKKMTVPKNGSPFLPIDDTPTSGEPRVSITPTPSALPLGASPTPSASAHPFDVIRQKPVPIGFCLATDSFNPPLDTAFQIIGADENIPSQNDPAFNDASMGNIVPPLYQYSGGSYPDLSKLRKIKKCKEGERSFFYGRICIPEFCNDLMCVTIDMKMKAKQKLSNLNCSECHVDRANAALDIMMETLGQNTPNANPMEPYFLRAIANLFKPITNNITIKPKPLPFLVYDESIIQDRAEHEKPDEQKSKEKQETQQKLLAEKNEVLYIALMTECPEVFEHFGSETVRQDAMVNYCTQVGTQRMKLVIDNYAKSMVQETKNNQLTQSYQKVLIPFYTQTQAKIQTINAHLQDINPQDIDKTNRHCKTTINP